MTVRAIVREQATRLAWSLLAPALACSLILRFLIPAPMEGRAGGAVAFVGRWADQHPLAAWLALFIALSAAINYWRTRRRELTGPARAGLLERRSPVRLAAMLAVAVVAALVVRTSLVQTYNVVSGSMVPSLVVGDRLLVSKLAYGVSLPLTGKKLGARLPRRGDVVVLDAGKLPWEKLPTQSIVKRVVGLPGDRISVDDGRVIINGWRVPACDAGPYVSPTDGKPVRGRLAMEFLEDKTYLTVQLPGATPFPTFTVPPGQVFVIGDDRINSNDSRTWNGGRGTGVAADILEGRVSRIIAGSHREDGRLDLSRLFARMEPRVRQAGVDLATTNNWIADCLKKRPAANATTPPPAVPGKLVPPGR